MSESIGRTSEPTTQTPPLPTPNRRARGTLPLVGYEGDPDARRRSVDPLDPHAPSRETDDPLDPDGRVI